MGGLVSYFWGASQVKAIAGDNNMADMEVPDKTTGLTGRDRREITDSWALVKKEVKNTGIELFIRFFTKFPDYQARFAAFTNVPVHKLREDKKLMAHAMSVMYAITAIVDNLNDPDCLVHMLTLLGTNHQRRKIPEQAFMDLKGVLMHLLQEKLGASLTKRGVASWDKTLTVAYGVIFKAMTDANVVQKPTTSQAGKAT